MESSKGRPSPNLVDRTLESRVSELYLSNMDMIGEGLPESVNSQRREALESFSLQSIPSKRSEKYRHFDLREVMSQEWEHYFTPPIGEVQGFEGIEVDGYQMELLNGFYRSKEPLVELENGVVYGSLREAFWQKKEVVKAHYNSIAGEAASVQKRLNTLFMQDGAFIYVPKGIKVDKPFVVTLEYESQERSQMCFGRMLVVLEQGAEADVVIMHHTLGKAKFMVDFVRESNLGEDAVLNIAEIVAMGTESAMVGGSYLKQTDRSQSNTMNLWLEGGGMMRADVVTDLAGEDCEANLHGLYFGEQEQRVNIDMSVNHLEPNCRSYELIKGVVSGSSVGAFTGRIFVARDAQKTVANQHSRNLQLSEGARIYAEPQLEIYADDVKCSHGATLGQLNDDAIHYMRQRGLSERDAERLRLYGFVNDIVLHCPVEAVVDELRRVVEEKIVAF